MAENVVLNSGSGGDTLAADDVGGVKIPRSKIVIGADGTNDGDVSASNPLPALVRSEQVDDAAFTPATSRVLMVGAEADETSPDAVDEGDGGALRMTLQRGLHANLRNSSGTEIGTASAPVRTDPTGTTAQPITDNAGSLTVDNAGTFAVQESGGALTALQIMDDWDESDRAKVNPIVGQAGVAAGAGAVSALTQRVTLASDDPAVTALQILDNAIAGSEMQVDVVAALPAGTNNIGDVDVLSIAAGDNNIGNVDIVTMPNVTLAAGTNTNEVVGDVAHDAAAAGNPVLVAARANANEPTAVADADSTFLWSDLFGRLVCILGHPSPESPITINATASGNTTVIAAPGASVSLVIRKGSIHNRASANRLVILQDGAGGTARWRAELPAEGGGSLFDFGSRGWKLTANTLLNVNLDAAGDVDVNITEYSIEP